MIRRKFRRNAYFNTYSGRQSVFLFCLFVIYLYAYGAYCLFTEQPHVVVASGHKDIIWGAYPALMLAGLLSFFLIWIYIKEMK